jgi:hypothetical protein
MHQQQSLIRSYSARLLQVTTMNARWLVLLLAAAVVSAQEITTTEIPSGYGSAPGSEEL